MAHCSTLPWLLLIQFHIIIVQIKAAAKHPSVIVFGDSTVDTGNNNHLLTIVKSNFPPYGRDFIGGKPTGLFSNGRIASDFISESCGSKPTLPAYLDPSFSIKDFATGVCFASASSGYDNVTTDVLDVLPLWKQLEYYKDYQMKLRKYMGDKNANKRMREALYVISMATNDFLENYYNPLSSRRKTEFTVEQCQDFLTGLAKESIKELYSLGARSISLGELPPMGCLPLVRAVNSITGSGICNEEYNKVADFNRKLQALVVSLGKELPGSVLMIADSYNISLILFQKPQKYGKLYFINSLTQFDVK
ncbi:hypothetical protein IFM89_036610 [Coptis chinensis]|uniref:GDSL esterase/lipase n=1 Tax=Coptis chinensis TaxID=261450 RepID=A0A835HJ72_9MAGN|nr:hypothetical protein IFM89_036610 [Coptis chinensis]